MLNHIANLNFNLPTTAALRLGLSTLPTGIYEV